MFGCSTATMANANLLSITSNLKMRRKWLTLPLLLLLSNSVIILSLENHVSEAAGVGWTVHDNKVPNTPLARGSDLVSGQSERIA